MAWDTLSDGEPRVCHYRLWPKTMPFRLRLRHSNPIRSRPGQSRCPING